MVELQSNGWTEIKTGDSQLPQLQKNHNKRNNKINVRNIVLKKFHTNILGLIVLIKWIIMNFNEFKV